ncbi:hypothetical protein C368_04831 [Cryptococcus neoformans 125.91]|nr:hypothetical protein C368_04831 [Cryptococcus neoformans var. grubii 125.91]
MSNRSSGTPSPAFKNPVNWQNSLMSALKDFAVKVLPSFPKEIQATKSLPWGMGMASYANLAMEMFVKFETMPQKMRDFYEATWFIRKEGKWGTVDIALKHDIGAIKIRLNLPLLCHMADDETSGSHE